MRTRVIIEQKAGCSLLAFTLLLNQVSVFASEAAQAPRFPAALNQCPDLPSTPGLSTSDPLYFQTASKGCALQANHLQKPLQVSVSFGVALFQDEISQGTPQAASTGLLEGIILATMLPAEFSKLRNI